MKRIFLFLLTNIAVMLVISLVLNLLNLNGALSMRNSDITGLLAASAVIGFTGSIISLLMSKTMAKMSVGAQVIKQPSNEVEQWLVETVRRQANQANIGMPEVAIYNSPDVNAFATGANKNNALVAVSTGLLHSMSRSEAEAVLAHEVSHVANGDMVTLALIQGVVNAFVMFFARIAGDFIDRNVFGREDGEAPGLAYFGITIVLDIVFGILASAVVMWFSRQREYRADEAGARLAGKQAMISALLRLQAESEVPDQMPKEMKAFAIAEGKEQGFSLAALFQTHPTIEQRVAALQQLNVQ